MTLSKNHQEAIVNFMADKGYEFREQMGSGYMFDSADGKKIVAVHRYYSRFYSIWSISEKY